MSNNLPISGLLSTTSILWLILLSSLGFLGYANYTQYVLHLEPCPLCMTQRFFVFLNAFLAFAAIVHNPKMIGSRIYTVLGILACIGGIFFASRHLHLQGLPPDQVPACGPNSLGFIFQSFPLTEAFSILLQGDGNCAEKVWDFLGLSMPAWVRISFFGLLSLWCIYPFLYKKQ